MIIYYNNGDHGICNSCHTYEWVMSHICNYVWIAYVCCRSGCNSHICGNSSDLQQTCNSHIAYSHICNTHMQFTHMQFTHMRFRTCSILCAWSHTSQMPVVRQSCAAALICSADNIAPGTIFFANTHICKYTCLFVNMYIYKYTYIGQIPAVR